MRHERGIDDVNDAVAGRHVRLDPGYVVDHDALALDGDARSLHGLDASRLHRNRGRAPAGDDVIREHRAELFAVGPSGRPSTVPAGSVSKASLVGANTVYGPSPLPVSTTFVMRTPCIRILFVSKFDEWSRTVSDGAFGDIMTNR